MAENFMAVGKIAGVHGVKGEVRALSWGDEAGELLQFKNFYMGKNRTLVGVEGARAHGAFVLLKLEKIDTPEEAYKLKGEVLYKKREEMPVLPEGRYYVADLIGLTAYLPGGEELGRVADVTPTGANDVFVIAGEKKEYLIPFIPSCVGEIDLKAKRLTVLPMEGLLDL